MRILISGKENGDSRSYEYNLLDYTNKETNTLSMARTTGYTCTAAANLVLNEGFTRKGICPPEYLGESEGNFSFVMEHLKQRGVIYTVKKSFIQSH